jgi:outer membrane lipoprotein-sorting protein
MNGNPEPAVINRDHLRDNGTTSIIKKCNKWKHSHGGTKVKKATLILMVLFLAASFTNVFALTVDEVIEKNIEAKGGREKLEAVKSMKTTGKMFTIGGMEAPFTMYNKRPDNYRFEATIQGMSMVQAYDGETAWSIMPWGGSTEPQKIPNMQAQSTKQQADMDGFLLNYKERGYKVELVGKEDMEGTEVYHLKLSNLGMLEGMTIDIYLDAEYFIEIKQTMKGSYEGQTFEVNTYMGDYKEVEGMMMAHSIDVKMGGKTVSTLVSEKIEINTEIDDSIFTMPVKEEKKAPEKEELEDK